MKVSQVIGSTLGLLGVTQVFGVVGSGNFHVTNALIDSGAAFTAARHEMGAACMANAYTQLTGEVSVVSVHQGCGLTNAITGVGEAAKAHTPLVILSGDTPAMRKGSNFWIEQDALVESVGAVAERIHRAETAQQDVIAAYHTAVRLRRPVVLSMPTDLQEEEFTGTLRQSLTPPETYAPAPHLEAIEHVAELLRGAQRPVILAGRGALGVREELEELAELSGALLATSAVARGLFTGNEWSLDVMGGFATDLTVELISASDLIVAFGASLNRWTTRGGALVANARLVQIDDRPAAFGFHREVDVEVLGDTRLAATELTEHWRARSFGTRQGYRSEELRGRLGENNTWQAQPFEDRGRVGQAPQIDPRTLTIALDEILPTERVTVSDGGNFLGYPGMFLAVPGPGSYLLPLGFQAIGTALTTGIGAAIAREEELVVTGIGDGGFLMGVADLETAVRLKLSMVIIVYNDAAYGAEVHHFEGDGAPLETVQFPMTDCAQIARGFGCEGVVVEKLEDLRAVEQWLNGPREVPLVIDARIAKFPSWVLAHSFEGD